MDLGAVFFLSLLAGYCFAYVWRGTAFGTRLIEGHHLYFRAALCGAVFFSIALALRVTLIQRFSTYARFDSAFVDYVRPILRPEPGLALPEQLRRCQWIVTAIYSLLLGAICAVASNLFTPRGWAFQHSASPLYEFLRRAQSQVESATATD